MLLVIHRSTLLCKVKVKHIELPETETMSYNGYGIMIYKWPSEECVYSSQEFLLAQLHNETYILMNPPKYVLSNEWRRVDTTIWVNIKMAAFMFCWWFLDIRCYIRSKLEISNRMKRKQEHVYCNVIMARLYNGLTVYMSLVIERDLYNEVRCTCANSL